MTDGHASKIWRGGHEAMHTEVTAMYSMVTISTAPPLPRRYCATAGGTSPAPTDTVREPRRTLPSSFVKRILSLVVLRTTDPMIPETLQYLCDSHLPTSLFLGQINLPKGWGQTSLPK